jgi:hypothetical protein
MFIFKKPMCDVLFVSGDSLVAVMMKGITCPHPYPFVIDISIFNIANSDRGPSLTAKSEGRIGAHLAFD